jgi:glycine/D-amino acid oxidase-like deaminating enzyme
VPVIPTKGEVLTISSEEVKLNAILASGGGIIPLPENKFKVSGTYEWDAVNNNPSEEGKENLVEIWQRLTGSTYQIIDHQAGSRPASIDRRPIVGMHPKFRNIGLFNGLGTKGITLAPYFAKAFTEHLLDREELHPEADIKRFHTLFQ